ncbi:MAG TPA: endonuclease III [Longimicrobiales bacterium]|nr:endonuclease III [Longimicrobiales bacterium]
MAGKRGDAGRKPRGETTAAGGAPRAGGRATQPPAKPGAKAASKRGGKGRGRRGRPPGGGARGKGAAAERGTRAARAAEIFDLLSEEYPDAHCELDFQNAFQLAVATILSAQTTDQRVNMVTPVLFARYPDARALASAAQEDVEEIIRSTGFFRNKARSIIGFARGLVAEHGGEVPASMEALAALPGVGRKTANVILGNAFGIAEGVVVDTHVKRLAHRLAFTEEEAPEKIEADLMELFPRERWTLLSHLLIWHGRRVCVARKPRCEACVVSHLCPSSRV